MQPLVFEPYLRPMVWGGRALGERYGKSLPTAGTYGESWELSAHKHHVSRVAEGPFRGAGLADLTRERPRDLFGGAAPHNPHFPLLFKLLDCRDLLSIQVHPNDALANELAGETFGKTEAWVILHAEPGAKVYAGFRPGVTASEVRERIEAGTLEAALHVVTPQPGDCIFLPAGTVHAVGNGVLMAEVQQTSDATFRLYDWDRVGPDGQKRELHIEKAIRSIDWEKGPVEPIRVDLHRPRTRLVQCPYFALERVVVSDRAGFEGGVATVWMVLDGRAELRGRPYRAGETVFVPAAAGDTEWQADRPATLLRVTLGPMPQN